jgi:hypothetical protein
MKIAFRIFVSLIVAGLILGAGAFVYKAGLAQGISQAPAVAAAISKAAENGQAAPVPPMMYGYGYGPGFHPMYSHHFGFLPFGICGSIIFLFFLFGFMKMIFFRRMMWHGGHHGRHGPWGRGCENGAPSMFNEWHKRAHGEVPSEEKNNDKDKSE